MHRAIVSLTIPALAVHLVLGCCAHHVHASCAPGNASGLCGALPEQGHLGHQHCGGGHADFGLESEPPEGRHEEPLDPVRICLGDQCSYVSGRTVQIDSSNDRIAFDLTVEPVGSECIVASGADLLGRGQRRALACCIAAPPLRAHLLLQVLLI